MARKPKVQLHPDVAAALPVALAAMDDVPARRGRKARADAFLPGLPPSGRDDTGPGGAGAEANGAVPAKAPRRPKRPTAAAAVSVPEDHAPKRRGPKPHGAPGLVKADAPDHEAGSQPAGAASADPDPMDAVSAVSGNDTQPPLPSLGAPSPVQPAAHWDRATDAVRFDWPAIEQTAAASGPNQGMAKLLVAARAEGANSRWPL